MTLAYSQYINEKPTYFVEKIWAGIKDHEVTVELRNYLHSKYNMQKSILFVKPKIHTIREDKSNRWKIGNKIHFVINNRTKNRLQFAPVLTVKAIQEIIIKHNKGIIDVWIDGTMYEVITFNNKPVDWPPLIQELAVNDGFDSVEDFFKWFDKDFKGKIIHWTDFIYSSSFELDTCCESCGGFYDINAMFNDADGNYFCTDCWVELKPILEKEYKQMIANGEIEE